VYGIPTCAPVYEDHRIKPVDAYSVSKAKAEEEVVKAEEKGIKTTMLRPTNVYGTRGIYTAGALFPALCILKERGVKIIRPIGGPPINMVHVEDVAGAIRFALENESTAGQSYNMAETDIYSAGEFFDLIIEQFSLPTRGTMKIMPGLMGIMGRVGMLMPSALIIKPAQKFLEREWARVVEKHDLVPALKPALARDFMPFLIGPHAYSNEKLCKAGYEIRHPSILKSFPEVIRWYRDERWIPDYS
jgi:nucleoside-diphosphate-sugar epimerase